MLLSKYFLPTLKETPSDAKIISHQLMLRAGLIRQLTSGIYNWLPFGLRVLKNIENIIREEMNHVDALEILMPCIQPVSLWEKSGRYGIENDLNDEMLQMTDRHGNKLLFTPTAEEAITKIFSDDIKSYKHLPINLYQIAWKFRDEIRPRYGVMRGREFLMKDAYSFDILEESAIASYSKMLDAYLSIYKRLGLTAVPAVADTGAIGGNYSHEFHVLAKTGESTIYYDHAVVDAIKSDQLNLKNLDDFYVMEESKHSAKSLTDYYDRKKKTPTAQQCINSKSIEVGHLFYLGTKYTESMNVKIQDAKGALVHPHMGCYGIGVSRLVGAIIEAFHDERGIIWPESVAPFMFSVINLKYGDKKCDEVCLNIYNSLRSCNIEALYDDTGNAPGYKLSNMDLIGIPYQIIVGPKAIESGEYEVKNRATQKVMKFSYDALMNFVLQ